MESYSRFQCEVAGARDRAQQLRREAAEQRLVRQLRVTSPRRSRSPQWGFDWRSRLAARLHAVAERLELHPDLKESHL